MRRRRLRVVEMEDGEEGTREGTADRGMVVEDGDGGRDIGWFVNGRKGMVIID